MAFEQNQQSQFNMNNGIDQVKQFQLELDKATASIGAAELEAEEELLGVRLKNLSKQQQTKLTQLGQMLELEEKGIQELAKLKLTLSNRQFAVRKKEIQKEFQLYKAAAEELFKIENKHKSSKSESTSKKASSTTADLKASTKKNPADVAIQKAERKVQSAIYGVDKVSQEITDAISSIQELATEAKVAQKGSNKQAAKSQASTANTDATGAAAEVKATAQKEQQFSDNANSMEEVDLGKFKFENIVPALEQLRATENTDVSSIIRALDSVLKTGKDSTSQNTIDLVGELVESANNAEKAIAKVREFNENRAQNMRLIQLAEEQKLAAQHAQTEYTDRISIIKAEAKANDIKNNKEQYILEARLARENAFYDEQNKLAEELAKAQGDIAWNADHRKELIDKKEQEARLGYLREYQELQADGFSHLTENITAEQFAALKAETAATEKAIKARSKTMDAVEKATAINRGKGTLKEKEQLIEAIVKERAAEKDWSSTKYEITDGMSDEEKAAIKAKQEAATYAELKIAAAMTNLANLAQQLNQQTDKIGAKQAPIDTRLQGSNVNDTMVGSYWKQLAKDMNRIGAVNPYFTQEDFANNIETLVNRGISFDIKQRAFLMTIQEKIANTFDVADGTLLRLVRIQQQDTTAGRLGMESALNTFLNQMYETSEYLSDVASSVRSSLGEMQALMEGVAGTELEFQVQKWMGSLYSVGMSQDAVQSIAQAFGQIASGDISGLTGSGTSNLLIMAANEAGMSIADILQDGLDAKETNKLMQAMVNYLAEIAETSSDSRVVQQQLANVYGMKASDLRAATNLASSIKEVSNQDLTYSGMLGQLNKMANSMILRTSTGEFLSNIWDNTQYTMATTMANDPLMYLLPRVATLLEDYAGGIDLPFVNVMGFGVDLNTSVAQLMNVAAMSGSILGSLGPMISGLTSAVNGSTMLSLAGINTSGKAPVIARGSAQPLQHLSGSSISESGYIGNASGNDIKNATLQDAEDSKKKQLVEAKDEESSDDVVIRSQQAIIDIYNLLEEVAHGSQSLRVRLVNANGGVVSFGGGGAAETTPTTPGAGINSGDNGNWVLSF